MTTLVLGGTGTVGGAVMRGLLGKGERVRIMTRDAAKAQQQPAGVDVRVGDLNDPRELGPVFDGVDAVFLLNALSMSETHEGLSALEWAKRARVRKLVYMSVHNVTAAPHIPHFAGKIVIEEAVRRSGLDYTILQPNNFFQNDYWAKDAIVGHGVYPHPIGSKGTNRVDVRDIADGAVNALTSGEHRHATYPIAGRDALTGEQVAAAWTKHLGKPVRYGGDNLDAWEQQSLQFMPGWLVFDLKMMYAYFHQHGLPATAEDLVKTEKAIGHTPRTFDAFVAETAKGWT